MAKSRIDWTLGKRRITTNQVRVVLKQAYVNEMYRTISIITDQIQDIINKLQAASVDRGVGGFFSVRYNNPLDEVEVAVDKVGPGKYVIQVLDDTRGGQIFNWLDQGTRGVPPGKRAIFPMYSGTNSTPDSLQISSAAAVLTPVTWVNTTKGTKGIEARNFIQQAKDKSRLDNKYSPRFPLKTNDSSLTFEPEVWAGLQWKFDPYEVTVSFRRAK